ncbi:MAG: PcfJ domain-containing protein [Clostridia bacterium]|nr:PcfJ domain-containing protein [Clostridia bacterium]
MEEKDIKPIPKYIIRKIRKLDDENRFVTDTSTRYYSYLTKINKDLARIIVACKVKDHQWFCKQVVVHTMNSDHCLVRDIDYSLFGYIVGWSKQILTYSHRRYDDGKWYKSDDKYYNVLCPIINKNYALKIDKYKYSAINKYKYLDIIKYLKIYEKYPQAEYLVKLNLSQFATNKSILKQVGKDKNFRKWLIKSRDYLKNEYGQYPYISSKVMLYAYKNNISIALSQKLDMKTKELQEDYNFRNKISKIIAKDEVITFINYLEKQETDCSTYADYLKACEKLNLDMTIDKNKYPKDFKKWHDIRIDQYHTLKAIEDEEKRKELYEKFEKVANKYLPMQRVMNEDFVVIIAKSPADLIKEGEILNHCVGRMNYDQKFAREESLIFFVRDKNNPQKPFVTVEYSLQNKKILQCYAKDNRKPQSNVEQFINKKWLPYAKRKLKEVA